MIGRSITWVGIVLGASIITIGLVGSEVYGDRRTGYLLGAYGLGTLLVVVGADLLRTPGIRRAVAYLGGGLAAAGLLVFTGSLGLFLWG